MQSGRLRALAVTSPKRIEAAPDVPTLNELGYTGIEASSWYGLYAPAGTPVAIIQRINAEMVKLAQDADYRQQLNRQGQEALSSSPEELRRYTRSVVRLMPDYQAAEAQYFRDTQIFPIMHALVIKTAVLDAHPWVAMNVYKAFLQAKTQSMARLADITASHAPMPWLADYASRMKQIFGEDYFPYGIGPERGGQINRSTLDAFCKYGDEQGVCKRRLSVDELFAANVLGSYKV